MFKKSRVSPGIAAVGLIVTVQLKRGQDNMPVKTTAQLHLRSLTGLRFCAAIAVVLYHFHRYFTPLHPGLDSAAYGFTGVSFFFILSGFVLAWSHDSGDRPGTFYWNRFSRIWPLHVLTTFFAIFVPPLTVQTNVWPALPFVLTLTQSWLPFGDYVATFNGVSWSLSCEAFFYLLFPLLIGILLPRRRLALFAITIYCAMIAWGTFILLSVPASSADYLLGPVPLYRLSEFVLGACLAIIMKRGWRPRFTLVHAALLATALYASLILASFFMSGSPDSLPLGVADLAMTPGFLSVIAATATIDLSGKNGVFDSQIMVRLGRWSFALYLVHELVIRVAKPLVDRLGVPEAFVAAAIVVAVSVALSGALHEFVEKPVEKFLRPLRVGRKAVEARIPEESRPGFQRSRLGDRG